MRFFITGGAGFIGSNYVDFLFKNIINITNVTIYDKFTYAGNSKNFRSYENDPRLTVIEGDICNLQLLEKSMSGHDYVVHFAAESHVDRSISNALAFLQTNVLGTYNILEASRKNKIKTVINVSTDEVYGSLAEGSADENRILQPNSPYAASKAASDLLARSYFITHNLDVRTTRCCNNYGKNQFPEKLIPVFIKKLASMQKIPIYGNGENVREWIHVSDHCLAIQTVLEKGIPGDIYNIGTGVHLSNNNLASLIIGIMKLSEEMKLYVDDRPGHDFRYSVNTNKLKLLGYSPQIEFNIGLADTITWYIENPDWWELF